MSYSQDVDVMSDDDLTIDGDIFNDFNEDLEATQVLEDERFYRYGRFFQACLGLGMTTFMGNRGAAYTDNHPTFHLSTVFFLSFRTALTLGIEYSKHTMFIDTKVNQYRTEILGAVETSFLRPFMGFRYYLDTTDLGTAITYSNPYFIAKMEYWYQTNKFTERKTLPAQEGGGLGLGVGAGLEFPIEIKKTYVSVEAVYHTVNYFDKFTQDYRQIPGDAASKYGYDDLTGDAITLIMSYNFTW
ncbi:MAG: hypothetical protein K2P81_08625 [Bacteriovoracaceae bacterium]|nr:hypothetical protein [Bacteriovoracaceae bacterium]